MSRNETEGEIESYHSARAQPEWIIMASPSDLAAARHLPHSVGEGQSRPKRILPLCSVLCAL
ncbi:MAG: hypothetical protein ABFR53_13525 [Actinomycetota bacterium]